MRGQPERKWKGGAAWTVLLLAAWMLLVLTLVLCLYSDRSGRHEVTALLVGDQPMVVLRRDPAIDANIAGLLNRHQRVEVLAFDADKNPDWALVQSGNTVGWVPLDRLSEKP